MHSGQFEHSSLDMFLMYLFICFTGIRRLY